MTLINTVLYRLFKLLAGGVGFHDLTYGASGEAQALADVSSVAAASKILLRLHGAFMLAAWIGAASIGMLLARYYRQTWVGSTLCGKDQWFAVSLCKSVRNGISCFVCSGIE